MRRLVGLFFGFMVATVATGCGALSTTHLRPSPSRTTHEAQTPVQFSLVAMQSNQIGWAVASDGLFRTGDGGRRWRRVLALDVTTTPGYGANSITESFVSATVAVIAFEEPDGRTIHMDETTDGGARWSMSTLHLPPRTAQLMSGGTVQVQFLSPLRGWLLLTSTGNAGSVANALFATTDGGKHCQEVQVPLPSHPTVFWDVTGIRFVEGGRVGIASVNSVLINQARVLVTTDGGQQWSSVALPLPPAAVQTQVVEGRPYISPSGLLILPVTIQVSGSSQELIFYTSGGQGATWTPHVWPKLLAANLKTNIPVYSATPGQYFVLADGQWLLLPTGRRTQEYQLVLSADNGLRWQRVDAIPMPVVASSSILPDGQGWAINSASMYETTSKGLSWRPWRPLLIR